MDVEEGGMGWSLEIDGRRFLKLERAVHACSPERRVVPSLTKTWCSLIREVTVIIITAYKYVHLIQERNSRICLLDWTAEWHMKD